MKKKPRTAGKLTDFIEANHEKIILEWVAFARTLLPWAKGADDKTLRDHAEELLTAVVADMKVPQSGMQQSNKSKGKSDGGELAAIGHKHATQRVDNGFNLDQLVSEYRALRASILRLWAEERGGHDAEITRFNEAIDESLAEATARYSEILDRTREQFLAILGHDLRNPLGAIVIGATLLTRSETLDDRQARVAARILTSAGRMTRMVSDLLDLTRTRLGAGIPVTRKSMDLGPVCLQVIAELEAIHPERQLQFDLDGDLVGDWDSDRLTQVVSNLVANALQYGREGTAVSVTAHGRANDVELRVHNDGAVIPAAALKKIFEPMVRQPAQEIERNVSGLGLGLYIAREVVSAHAGTITVSSSAKGGTTFTVRLPRHAVKKMDTKTG